MRAGGRGLRSMVCAVPARGRRAILLSVRPLHRVPTRSRHARSADAPGDISGCPDWVAQRASRSPMPGNARSDARRPSSVTATADARVGCARRAEGAASPVGAGPLAPGCRRAACTPVAQVVVAMTAGCPGCAALTRFAPPDAGCPVPAPAARGPSPATAGADGDARWAEGAASMIGAGSPAGDLRFPSARDPGTPARGHFAGSPTRNRRARGDYNPYAPRPGSRDVLCTRARCTKPSAASQPDSRPRQVSMPWCQAR
jgi:hypothetical protein